MPWTGTEIAEVSVGNPINMARVGDWLVCVDGGRASPAGTLPLTGTWCAMNTITGQAKVATGLPTTTYSVGPSRLVGESGYAWFASGAILYRLNPVTMTVLAIPSGIGGSSISCLATWPGKVVALPPSTQLFRVYDIASGTWTSSAVTVPTTTTAVGVGTDRLVLAQSSGSNYWPRVHDDTGAALTGNLNAAGVGIPGAGFALGGKAYYPTTAAAQPFYNVVDAYALTATGTNTGITSLFAGGTIMYEDGWFYCYRATNQAIYAISAVTGAIDFNVLPTSRARRAPAGIANGTWWVPSGEPLT